MSVGRNDPCPCGSGKKYKKCCLNKPAEVEALEVRPEMAAADGEDLIAPGEIGDYGPPRLSREFLDAHPLVEFSAQRIACNFLLRPDLVSATTGVMRQLLLRGREEARRIKQAEGLEELIQIMHQRPDSLNHELLFDRLLARAEEAVPRILAELPENRDDSFAELAINVIYRSKQDVEAELLEMIKRPIAQAYTLSLVCLLLGMTGSAAAVKPLWDCYHFFKEKFPHEYYREGPLIGLDELHHRLVESLWEMPKFQQIVELSMQQAGLVGEPDTARRVAELFLENQRRESINLLLRETGADFEGVEAFAKRLTINLSPLTPEPAEPSSKELSSRSLFIANPSKDEDEAESGHEVMDRPAEEF